MHSFLTDVQEKRNASDQTVDWSENFVDLADLLLVLQIDGSIEMWHFVTGRLADHFAFARMHELAHFCSEKKNDTSSQPKWTREKKMPTVNFGRRALGLTASTKAAAPAAKAASTATATSASRCKAWPNPTNDGEEFKNKQTERMHRHHGRRHCYHHVHHENRHGSTLFMLSRVQSSHLRFAFYSGLQLLLTIFYSTCNTRILTREFKLNQLFHMAPKNIVVQDRGENHARESLYQS